MENISDAEKAEYTNLSSILTQVLSEYDFPISVSFMNTQLNGSIVHKCLITQTFMHLYKDSFAFLLVGNDLKIHLKNRKEKQKITGNNSLAEDVRTLRKIISKDLSNVNSLNLKISENNGIVKYDDLSRYGSRKKPLNFSFVLRNSHSFKILSKHQETYVELVKDWENNITATEESFWQLISKEKLQGVLFLAISNILFHFFTPLKQGTLQCSFNYGSVVLDKTFTSSHYKCLKIEKDEISLTPEFRNELNKKLGSVEECNKDKEPVTETNNNDDNHAHIPTLEKSQQREETTENNSKESNHEVETERKEELNEEDHLLESNDDENSEEDDSECLESESENIDSNEVKKTKKTTDFSDLEESMKNIDLDVTNSNEDTNGISEDEKSILKAIKEGRSVVFLGTSNLSPKFFYSDVNNTTGNNRAKLQLMKDLADSMLD